MVSWSCSPPSPTNTAIIVGVSLSGGHQSPAACPSTAGCPSWRINGNPAEEGRRASSHPSPGSAVPPCVSSPSPSASQQRWDLTACCLCTEMPGVLMWSLSIVVTGAFCTDVCFLLFEIKTCTLEWLWYHHLNFSDLGSGGKDILSFLLQTLLHVKATIVVESLTAKGMDLESQIWAQAYLSLSFLICK